MLQIDWQGHLARCHGEQAVAPARSSGRGGHSTAVHKGQSVVIPSLGFRTVECRIATLGFQVSADARDLTTAPSADYGAINSASGLPVRFYSAGTLTRNGAPVIVRFDEHGTGSPT